MGLYGAAFIGFIAIEFSVYESLMWAFEHTTGGRESIVSYMGRLGGDDGKGVNGQGDGAAKWT